MADPKKPPRRSDVLAKARQRLGLEIVPGKSDRPGLLTLTRLVYPQLDISDPTYIAWQYDQNPAGPAQERLGRVAGNVVGQYAVIPVHFQLANREMAGSVSVNTMTHPDYRGQGIFMILADEVYRSCQESHIKLTLGFPNPSSHKGFIRHLNFTDAGQLPLWLMPLSPEGLKQSEPVKRSALLSALLTAGAPFWSLALSWRSASWKPWATIKELKSFDNAFDVFWDKAKAGYPNCVVRDKTYLQWRFAQHPTRTYRIFGAYTAQELAGYLVARNTTIQGTSCGMIVDLFVPATEAGKQTALDLVRHATQLFKQDNIALAGCLAPSHSATAYALKKSGYWPCPDRFLPQPFPVILRWHGDDPPPANFYDLRLWYLTMGDYDAV